MVGNPVWRVGDRVGELEGRRLFEFVRSCAFCKVQSKQDITKHSTRAFSDTEDNQYEASVCNDCGTVAQVIKL